MEQKKNLKQLFLVRICQNIREWLWGSGEIAENIPLGLDVYIYGHADTVVVVSMLKTYHWALMCRSRDMYADTVVVVSMLKTNRWALMCRWTRIRKLSQMHSLMGLEALPVER